MMIKQNQNYFLNFDSNLSTFLKNNKKRRLFKLIFKAWFLEILEAVFLAISLRHWYRTASIHNTNSLTICVNQYRTSSKDHYELNITNCMKYPILNTAKKI
jgi:hypothetical protein